MTRGQVVVLVVFGLIVAAMATFLMPLLFEKPSRPTNAVEDDFPTGATRPASPVSPASPAPRTAAPTSEAARESVRVSLAGPYGRAHLRLVGARGPEADIGPTTGSGIGETVQDVLVQRTGTVSWIGYPAHLWLPIDWGAGDKQSVTLKDAGPSIAVTVTEADGQPAADVPVLWPGPDGKPMARRTDAAGRVAIDDQPAGLVIASVGGTERAGPTLRLRVGVDQEARAVVDAPLVVTGRVLDARGGAVADAEVAGVVPDGPAGRTVRTDDTGAFRWAGRATDRLTIVARAKDGRTAAIDPPLADARGPLVAAANVTLPAAAAAVEISTRKGAKGAPPFTLVRAEPSALALAREAFGADAVTYEPVERVGLAGRLTGLGFEGPVRLQVRGDVVPEDHLVAAATDLEPRRLEVGVPRAASAEPAAPASAASPAAAKALTGTLVGRVRSVAGVPLAGVTVRGNGLRATTDASGRFELSGLLPGERVDLVYCWLGGADTAGVDPAPFAPWFAASAKASVPPAGGASPAMAPPPATPAPTPAEPVDLVLPAAASVTLRATSGIDGRPLSWVRIVILDGAGEARYDGVVATREGRVRIDGLVAGTSGTLLALAPSLRREVALSLRAGETVDVGEVPLVVAGRVEGTVRGADSAPIAGATVAAIDDGRGEGGGRAIARAADLSLRRATTSADGHFVLDGLDPTRPPSLAVYARGFAPAARQPLFGEDGTARADITLSRGATLRVRIEDPTGRGLEGVAVELRDARSGARWLDLVRAAGFGGVVGSSDDLRVASEALLTEDVGAGRRPGFHRLGPVEPGPYAVIALRPGYKPARARTTVAPSAQGPENPLGLAVEAMELRIVMEPEPAPGK